VQNRKLVIIAASLAGAALTVPAQAQRPAAPPQVEAAPPKLDPKACSDRERAKSGDTQETQGSAVPKDDPSDKLARTDGVICPPPDIDPNVRQPAPSGGNMPVISPPGSPGGDPSVQPK
jgi:hypothetical protein